MCVCILFACWGFKNFLFVSMSRKQNNYRRGGGSGGNRRFGGTGSLGNYNRSGKYHDEHEENRRSGSWGGNNFNRSYVGSGNHHNFNSGNQQLNNQENGFQKFRDPHILQQHSNMRSQHDSQERIGHNRNRNRRVGKQNYGNDSRKNSANWYEDGKNAPLKQGKETNQNYSSPPDLHVSATSNLPQTTPIVTTLSTISSTLQHANNDEVSKGNTQEEQKHIIKNIKQEKFEVKEDNRIVKQTKQSESSCSSSESSESENEAEINKKEPNLVKSKTIKVKPEPLGNETSKINTESPNTSSSSSSSSSSSEKEDDKVSDKTNERSRVISNTVLEKGPKIAKKQSNKKHSSEEDLICLGKLEKKFIIEDDVSEETEVPKQNKSVAIENQCLICDKQGHTAFECQMICKNCSAPYHNMKSCPKPANLNTMLKSFMEFCIGQMSQFNPDHKFTIPTNICANDSPLSKNNLLIAGIEHNKIVKKQVTKSKNLVKKLTKRKYRHASSDDEEEDEDDGEEYKIEEHIYMGTSESESESDSREEIRVSKAKKRRTKAHTPMKTPNFHNTFVPPFSSFPAFGAAAAAYNPLLLSQLMNNGGFGGAEKLNFQ